ncbi:hypothetical protein HQ394_10990 [Defluviicoccus vanus]|uniref:Uncharacterized protein n=2 Tax=Defluviicoccus vanus TaxID=111831 RepID=A0A7H1N211_9PROT|nr:hypothetical protein HQ394_10990 [Defluviicoccus vanus]
MATLAAAPLAAAERELTPLDTKLSDAAIDARIRFIEERLDASKMHGQIWYWSWLSVNSVSAVGLGVFAGLADDKDDRVNNGVNAGIAALGVVDVLFRPLQARLGASPVSGLPEETREEKIDKLRAQRGVVAGECRAGGGAYRLADARGEPGVGRGSGIGDRPSRRSGGRSDLRRRQRHRRRGLSAFGTGRSAADWRDYQKMTGKDVVTTDIRLSVNMLPGGGRLGLAYTW